MTSLKQETANVKEAKELFDIALELAGKKEKGKKPKKSTSATWENYLKNILQDKKEGLSLKNIYTIVSSDIERIQKKHWQASIRGVLQNSGLFSPIKRGIWKLN